jgi:hypothetical protein
VNLDLGGQEGSTVGHGLRTTWDQENSRKEPAEDGKSC